ncbi:MAG: monovalent cation/H(+) antiporter subunit G [Chloroflexi bacterium]|nr:monovalent cation/H(+) antiporter subunit G [Chloroflexota bacterium]
MAEIISQILMLIGAAFMFIAALGVLRMPDLFIRMHANAKSATLGVMFMMAGLAIHFADIAITTRAVAVILFLFATSPVAAQMIGRAAYFSRVPIWEGTLSDEMQGQYDTKTHTLKHPEIDDSPDEA